MDQKFMQMALELAARGKGYTSPNPVVGAVIVKNGRIIGQGYHEACGRPHAEVNAFQSLTESARGACLYVTLEPCSHYGKTPPCADAVIKHGLARVVVGMKDPNPLVAGRGIKKLQEAGIQVVTGILEDECRKINEIFIKYILTKQPFILYKAGMTLDGKIALPDGSPVQITGSEAMKEVHKLRHDYKGIMVGIETVLMDDPQLTCRSGSENHPVRIIADSQLRIPLKSKLVETACDIPVIVLAGKDADDEKKQALSQKGVRVLQTNNDENHIDLKEAARRLGEEGIDSILLEGGPTLGYSAIKAGIVDKIQFYLAPVIMGGSKTVVAGRGAESLDKAFGVENMLCRPLGTDLVIEAYPASREE